MSQDSNQNQLKGVHLSTFLVPIILPLIVIAISNVFRAKLDCWQKGSAVIALVAFAFLVSYTLSKPPTAESAPTKMTILQQTLAVDSKQPISSSVPAEVALPAQRSHRNKKKAQTYEEPTAPAFPTQSLTQRPLVSAPNGVAISGNNYGTAQVTNNNYDLRPLPSLTVSQLAALTAAVEPFKGTSLSIAWETGNRNKDAFIQRLSQALQAGGL